MHYLTGNSYCAGAPGPEDTPIDGGISLLIAAGAAYGVKKYHNKTKVKVKTNA